MLARCAYRFARAIPPQDARSTATITLRVERKSVDAIAAIAKAEGITKKQVTFRALAAAGVPVAKVDLEDRTPRRAPEQ